MGRDSVSANESIFTVAGTPLVFGPGAALETGWHLRQAGVTRALVVTDPNLAALGLIDPVVAAIRAAGVEAEVFAESGIEPSESSVQVAVEVAREGGFDGFVGLGGGSSIDTAKIAALLATHPGGIYDYLNPPIGKGTPIPGPLLPLFGVPTTGGTGAEATTVAIIDLPEHHVKTGHLARLHAPAARHRRPRPDADDAARGDRVGRPRRALPRDRVVHRDRLRRAPARRHAGRPAALPGRQPRLRRLERAGDQARGRRHCGARWPTAPIRGARRDMALAASAAGRAFGQAGVHIPHACSYPVAGLKHEWKPPGYPGEDRFVPHGIAVVLTAPASFRFTEPAAPERHRRAAELLAGEPVEADDHDALARGFEELMRAVGAPSGLREIGYGEADLPDLVAGTLKQQRLLVCAPCPVTESDLDAILRASL